MIDPLRDAAARWPDAPALADASTELTWSGLCDAAAGLAGTLRIEPGTRVGLLAEDRASSVVAIHAVRLAGGVLVPLHRRLATPELRTQAVRARVALLLHDEVNARRAIELQGTVGVLVDLDAHADGTDPLVAFDAATIGMVIHTSGTTAEPRGVLLTHDALLASAGAWNELLSSGPTDHWLSTLPLAHVAGLGMVLRSVCAGAKLTVHDRFEVDAVRATLESGGVTLMSLVPAQLARLLDVGPLSVGPLRALLLGGGPVPSGLVRQALDAGLPIVTTYGLTEAASGVTALPADEAPDARGSAGRALPGVLTRLVDGQGSDVPVGSIGTILVGGPTITSGYDHDPDATAAALRDGWLRTRDLGRMDPAGRLWVLDREDELIITGGENVSPAEVAGVLSEHPAIADVAVVGRPHPTWGAVPVVVVVPRDGSSAPSIEALRTFGRARLAGYKLPVAVRVASGIPRTASGKVITRHVRALLDGIGTDGAETASWDIARPDGASIHVETRGSGLPLLLLHATLSNVAELRGLAELLARRVRVVSVDRRSAGGSRMPADDAGGAVDVGIHVDDLVNVLDIVAPGRQALVVGHSFGGCVALEMGARQPGRVAGVWVFEPPYLPLLPDPSDPRDLGDRIDTLAREQGPAAAALAFLDAVRGPGTAGRLPPRARERLGAEGRAAVADAALLGLEPDGLHRIEAPVVVGLGGRSGGPYGAVADELARRVPIVTIEHFRDLGHGGPVSRPETIASSIVAFAGTIGHSAVIGTQAEAS